MSSVGSRRLAAVWFADIVGYSALSARDEDGALALVRVLQEVTPAEASAHGGRVVKFVGDAALAVFESVEGAILAALAVHERFDASEPARAHEARLRIGLHLGEITEASDGDVYGDGVNVASRLQGKAKPGEVVVSRVVQEMMRGRAAFVFQRLPVWHHLKGMGLTRVFVVGAADAPPAPRRPLPSRAIGMGLVAGMLAFFALMTNVAMHDEGATDSLAPADVEDGTVRLNLGMEHYFAGELADVIGALDPFTREPLRDHPDAARALRFLARAELQAGQPDLAHAALVRMVATEPPMALLIPSAEEDSLMALYYEARRDALRGRAVTPPSHPVGGVVLFDLETVLDVEDEGLEELGPSVSQMLGSELEGAGIATRYFWALMVGFSGEGAYRQFERELAAGPAAATHALLGRVAVRGGEVAVSGQVYELATGTLVSTELVTGAWPDGLFEVVERLGSATAKDLLAGSRPSTTPAAPAARSAPGGVGRQPVGG